MPVSLAMLASAAALAAGADGVQCPAGMTHLDSFELAGASWVACENLQRMDGAIALLSNDGRGEWFAKGHEEYADPSAVEAEYYFPAQGLNKSAVVKDPVDILGQTILSKNFTHVRSSAPRRPRCTAQSASCRALALSHSLRATR